jgi:hypothetical protein
VQSTGIGTLQHRQTFARTCLRNVVGGLGDFTEITDGQIDGAHQIDIALISLWGRTHGEWNNYTHWDARSLRMTRSNHW